MKKTFLLTLSIVFIIALFACSDTAEETDNDYTNNDPSINDNDIVNNYPFPRLIDHNYRGRAFPLYFDLVQRDNLRLEFYVLHPHPDSRGAERITILRYNEYESFSSEEMHLIHRNGYTYMLGDGLPGIYHRRQEDVFWYTTYLPIPIFDDLILFTGFGVTTFNGVPHEFEEYTFENGWSMQFLFDNNDEIVLIRSFHGSRFLGLEEVVLANIDWDVSASDFEIPADYREFNFETDRELIGL